MFSCHLFTTAYQVVSTDSAKTETDEQTDRQMEMQSQQWSIYYLRLAKNTAFQQCNG